MRIGHRWILVTVVPGANPEDYPRFWLDRCPPRDARQAIPYGMASLGDGRKVPLYRLRPGGDTTAALAEIGGAALVKGKGHDGNVIAVIDTPDRWIRVVAAEVGP